MKRLLLVFFSIIILMSASGQEFAMQPKNLTYSLHPKSSPCNTTFIGNDLKQSIAKKSIFNDMEVFWDLGVSYNWTLLKRGKKDLNSPYEIITTGHPEYRAQMGILYAMNDAADFYLTIGVNYFNGVIETWDRTPLGKMNCFVYSINPFLMRGDISDRIDITFSLFRLLIFTGKAKPDNDVYFSPTGEAPFYLISNIGLKNKIGYDGLTIDLDYATEKRAFSFGINITLLQWIEPKITINQYEYKLGMMNGFFPTGIFIRYSLPPY